MIYVMLVATAMVVTKADAFLNHSTTTRSSTSSSLLQYNLAQRARRPHQRNSMLFQHKENKVESDSESQSYRPGSLMAATAEQGRVPYGEESRKYRQTEFTYDDWVSHRNSEKFLSNLSSLLYSGIVRQLKEEILLVTLVATFVVFWNDFLVFPVDMNFASDASGMTVHLPKLSLPALPFTLSSPALGLLLVFKTNASYGRWSEARNTWAKIVAQSRNTVRMAATFVPQTEEGQSSIKELSDAIWLLCRSLMNDLSGPADEEKYRDEVIQMYPCANVKLGEDSIDLGIHHTANRIINSPDRSMTALAHATCALDSLPIDEKRRVEIDKSLVIIGDCIGICEKIYTSPVPLVYTRHTGRFLSLWMIMLPSALYDAFVDTNKVSSDIFNFQCLALVPATAIVGLFLFGIDELAIQLEEPFSILPMQKFCDKVQQSTRTIADWCMGKNNQSFQATGNNFDQIKN